MPWHAISMAPKGDIKPCCVYSMELGKNTDTESVINAYNSDLIKHTRRELLKGNEPRACNMCWEREDLMGYSRRIWFEEKFGKYIPERTDYTEEEWNPQFVQADVNLGNLCNLKCRMCGSWASTEWYDENNKLAKINPRYGRQITDNKHHTYDIDYIKQILPNIQDIKRIDFKGGEPMLAKAHNQFLEWLIEIGKTDIHLLYTTNGTVINPRIKELFSHFSHISLIFSIEGTGERYRYIRGGRYGIDQIENNISEYNQIDGIDIGFNVTIQNYNLLGLRDLHEQLWKWHDEYENVDAHRAFTTICNKPKYLSPMNVPDGMRDTALEQLDGMEDFTGLCNSLRKRQFRPRRWQLFKEFTQDLDRMREDSLFTACPEFVEYWDE